MGRLIEPGSNARTRLMIGTGKLLPAQNPAYRFAAVSPSGNAEGVFFVVVIFKLTNINLQIISNDEFRISNIEVLCSLINQSTTLTQSTTQLIPTQKYCLFFYTIIYISTRLANSFKAYNDKDFNNRR